MSHATSEPCGLPAYQLRLMKVIAAGAGDLQTVERIEAMQREQLARRNSFMYAASPSATRDAA
jgi:hypothetical protein